MSADEREVLSVSQQPATASENRSKYASPYNTAVPKGPAFSFLNYPVSQSAGRRQRAQAPRREVLSASQVRQSTCALNHQDDEDEDGGDCVYITNAEVCEGCNSVVMASWRNPGLQPSNTCV